MEPIELSFEFFPPKSDDGIARLRAARAQLMPLAPKFVSVTFGAGGSTQQGTLDTVLEIARTGVDAAPHLSCIGASRAGLADILDTYRAQGISHIVALRGDMPSGMVEMGDFRYAAHLVAFIREHAGDAFRIEVAAYPEYHPQSRSPRLDLEHFVAKVRAGADAAISQYFFNADAYFRFVDEVRRAGVDVPITPGIMPITNYSQLIRFSEMCGAEVPRWIARRLESYGDDRASIRAFGAEVVAAMCERLIAGGAPGLHFYTLNGAEPTRAICDRLGLHAPGQ
ncbi:methylenetetrahydrofolate reductase [NAD(P)H] [Robbsia sp. Bb-Pol-6]|uniref:Methylenetetrahydrofolate reductase n=1 Tax=Robbsia betulipollinis TaxID=2981849 RepID=A0ABT3ZKI0_9BURK|nr:methylenetetrahydrofolate reductase [NAD(P)H] [Robbsia betulipollinis]MCY0386932.1 methylenetetrahydrofolate reductase [NAD(P)H] [Robbsia betulipollinis]